MCGNFILLVILKKNIQHHPRNKKHGLLGHSFVILLSPRLCSARTPGHKNGNGVTQEYILGPPTLLADEQLGRAIR